MPQEKEVHSVIIQFMNSVHGVADEHTEGESAQG